jgi:hypothetical protein
MYITRGGYSHPHLSALNTNKPSAAIRGHEPKICVLFSSGLMTYIITYQHGFDLFTGDSKEHDITHLGRRDREVLPPRDGFL